VGVGFRGDEGEFMIGHTLSDPSGSDLVPDTGNALALHVYGGMDVDADVEVGTANLYVKTTTGQVGIGTDTPHSGETLEVVGDARITSTASGSTGGPDLTLWRDRVGANGNYLGRIFFSGRADSGSGQKNYAVIRGKINDATSSSEDGLIEYALQRDSTLTPVSRLTSSDLKLISGTGLTVEGDVAVDTDTLFVDVSTDRVGINTTTPGFDLDVRGDANVATMNVYTIQGLQTLAFSSDNTNTPPLQLTAGSLNDGVGALRIDSVEPDIYLNDTDGGFATITFANNDVARAAFGRDSGDDFYITVRDPSTNGGNWRDTTLVVDSSTGNITTGYNLGVSTTTFTGSNVREIGGTANAVAYWGDGTKLDGVALETNFNSNVSKINILQANVVDLWDNVYSNASTLATLKTDHENNVVRITNLETYQDDNAARLDTASDDISDLENTRALKLDPTFTSNITVSNVAYVNNGLVVNNTRFYSYSGSMTNPSSTIGLEFASNVFYARVMAQMVYNTEDVNTLVLELQGGKKIGTSSKNIKVGTLNKFGDTAKPWSSTVTTTATEVTIQPEDLNQDYDYELMIEYTSAGTDSKLVAVKEGSTAVKNFAY